MKRQVVIKGLTLLIFSFSLLVFFFPTPGNVVAQSCVQPPSGLVSWWPLDETDGATTADIIEGNDGTLVNGPIQVVGKVAGALSFDGIDDYVDLGSNSSLDIPGSVTIDAWVKFIGFVKGWYSYFVADFDNTGTVSQLSLAVSTTGGDNFQFYSYEGRDSLDNTYVYSSPDKTEGLWYHVAVVRDDAAKTIKLYVNGNLEGIKSYSGKEPVSLQGKKYLGSSGPFADFFNGNLDEVEIYNRALSDSEIQAIFEAGSAGKCTFTIDIKPGSYPNCFSINSHGVIPVAILGRADFDVTQIDISTLDFAGLQVRVKGNGAPQCSVEDVSGDFTYPEGAPDGYLDLVCQFAMDSTAWTSEDGYATLTANLLDGTPISGTDEICIVP